MTYEFILGEFPNWAIPLAPKIIEKIMNNVKISDPNTTTGSPEDTKGNNLKYSLSKFEDDLYHEEDDVVEKIIRVKRICMPNKDEKWKIFENNKAVFVVEGNKLSKKEKEFLRTVDGVNFLISEYKNGIKSFNSLKKEIKKKI